MHCETCIYILHLHLYNTIDLHYKIIIIIIIIIYIYTGKTWSACTEAAISQGPVKRILKELKIKEFKSKLIKDINLQVQV